MEAAQGICWLTSYDVKFKYMRYEVSKNKSVVVSSSENLIMHKLRVEIDQKDISVM